MGAQAPDVIEETTVAIIGAFLWLVAHGIHGAAVIALPAMIWRHGDGKNVVMSIDKHETARTQARYQRIAPIHDGMELFAERRYADWRPRFWSWTQGPQVLEVGVGTGKNIPYYPDGAQMTAIDLTPGMLELARAGAAELNAAVALQFGDVQALDFPDETFDDVVATFVFCLVPDPVLSFDEIAWVLKPNGSVHLLEHVRSPNLVLGTLMDLLDLVRPVEGTACQPARGAKCAAKPPAPGTGRGCGHGRHF